MKQYKEKLVFEAEFYDKCLRYKNSAKGLNLEFQVSNFKNTFLFTIYRVFLKYSFFLYPKLINKIKIYPENLKFNCL